MTTNKKILVAGAQGQLAQAFIARFQTDAVEYYAPDETLFDITDEKKVEQVIDEFSPDVLINCAAYNLVDDAEENTQKVFRINADAVRILADQCNKKGILLVHFSSDYVFDGTKGEPYAEEDTPNPLNVYGKSKLAGDTAIIDTLERYLIFRLSWVFGKGKQNFLYKVSSWIEKRSNLNISDDEVSSPTYTEDVVTVVLKALDSNVTGLYHLANSGYCSRFEWVKYYCQAKKIEVRIDPVSMKSFIMKAKRPVFSALSNERIATALSFSIPKWQDAVSKFADS